MNNVLRKLAKALHTGRTSQAELVQLQAENRQHVDEYRMLQAALTSLRQELPGASVWKNRLKEAESEKETIEATRREVEAENTELKKGKAEVEAENAELK